MGHQDVQATHKFGSLSLRIAQGFPPLNNNELAHMHVPLHTAHALTHYYTELHN